jgi:hypothetical protein
MPTATKAPKAKLTLRDGVDLLAHVRDYIEEHIDEIELNGGALPDDMIAILDEVDAAMADRVDALAFKIDEFTGYAVSAGATKDRAARRERVWKNAIKAMKAYGKFQVERNGGEPLKGSSATLRLQKNGQASTEIAYTGEQLLAIYDAADRAPIEEPPVDHPLSSYITVSRVASIDTRAVCAAYEARREQLEAEADLIGASDILEALSVDSADVAPTNNVAEEIDR